MSEPTELASELIHASGAAYASRATEDLLQRNPDVGARFGGRAFAAWKAEIARRFGELANALSFGEPALFAAQAEWAVQCFHARKVPPEDLRASFEAMREALAESLPAEANAAVKPYFDAAEQALAKPASEIKPLAPTSPTNRLALEYILALLEGDAQRAHKVVLDAIDNGLPVPDAYLKVVVPALNEMGFMWHAGEINVAEEHFVSASSERLLTRLLDRAPRAPAKQLTVLGAAVAGNSHAIGPRIVADFFEMAGWRVVYLGANMPPEDIAQGAIAFEADVLVLSATLTTHLDPLKMTIATVRAAVADSQNESKPRIIVGGRALAQTPDLWKALGADAYSADPEDAVKIAERLATSS